MDPRKCWHCEYDLSGLPDRQRCPECGMPERPPVIAQTEPDLALPGFLLALVSMVLLIVVVPLACVVAAAAVALCLRAYCRPRGEPFERGDLALAITGMGIGSAVAIGSAAYIGYLLLVGDRAAHDPILILAILTAGVLILGFSLRRLGI